MSKSVKSSSPSSPEWHQATLSPDALQLLIMGMPIPIIVTNQKDARILMANDAAQSLLSSPSKAFIGETTFALKVWASPLARAQAMKRLNAEGSITNHRMERRDEQGNLQIWIASLSALLIDGTPCILSSFKEDTKNSASEDLLRENERRLRCQLQAEKMEAIGHLSSALAHDFNNILAAIMLRLELLSIETEPTEAMCLAIHELGTEAKRAANITRQMLLFSRREAMSRQELNLNELLRTASETLARLVCPGIKLDVQDAPEMLLVEADASHIEQVLFQLVANARDAMGNGGTIQLRLGKVFIPATHASLPPGSPAGPHACIIVADHGVGMDENTRRHIFEPFFTTKPAGKGSGMGLATVYGIMQQHRGWVEVDSKPSRGSVFTLYLPLFNRDPKPPALTKTNTPRGNILIVEDDPSIRRISALLLQQKGFSVFEAATGREGFTLWQRHRDHIKLLMVDLILPDGLIGLDLIAEAKLTHPDTPCILMSGFDTEAELQLDLPSKCGFLHKPFDTQSILLEVQKALALRQS